VFGGIVDVSAGGVRLRIRPGQGVAEGSAFDVALEVSLPSAPQAVPPVRLCGTAVTVRAYETDAPAFELALRFLAPLAVWDGFGAPAAIQSIPEPSVPTGV